MEVPPYASFALETTAQYAKDSAFNSWFLHGEDKAFFYSRSRPPSR